MDNDFLDKLIEHGCSQFRKISVPFGEVDKFRHSHTVGVPVVQQTLPLRHRGFQRGLFLVILGKEAAEMLVRQLARGVCLVQLLHQSVQFGVALLRLGNLLPAVLDRFLLSQTGRLPDTLNKLLLVVADIPAYPLDGGEDRRFQLLRGDIVNGTILHRRPVSGTGESIVNVLALNKAVVVGQLCAAVGTVEQAGQTVGAAAPFGCPALGFP